MVLFLHLPSHQGLAPILRKKCCIISRSTVLSGSIPTPTLPPGLGSCSQKEMLHYVMLHSPKWFYSYTYPPTRAWLLFTERNAALFHAPQSSVVLFLHLPSHQGLAPILRKKCCIISRSTVLSGSIPTPTLPPGLGSCSQKEMLHYVMLHSPKWFYSYTYPPTRACLLFTERNAALFHAPQS